MHIDPLVIRCPDDKTTTIITLVDSSQAVMHHHANSYSLGFQPMLTLAHAGCYVHGACRVSHPHWNARDARNQPLSNIPVSIGASGASPGLKKTTPSGGMVTLIE